MKFVYSTITYIQVYQATLAHLLLARKYPHDKGNVAKSWSTRILDLLDLDLEVKGNPVQDPSMLFLGNHISYLDIPLLMKTVPDISFMAKAELARWPLFGDGARAANTIFVQRDSNSSRSRALLTLEENLLEGRRVVLFPSGTTSLDESKPWKRGAFSLAKKMKIKVQPFRLTYTPLRVAAYIDDDFFPAHLNKLCRHGKIHATLEFHEPVIIDHAETARKKWEKWARELMHTN